jgi:hypothetical protein
MASNALIKSPKHNHDLSLLNDVDNTAKANGKTLVWDAATGKHIYVTGGTGNSFDPNTIVTGKLKIDGLNDPDYLGNEIGLILIDNEGNVITT